jgi:hypothetical protein
MGIFRCHFSRKYKLLGAWSVHLFQNTKLYSFELIPRVECELAGIQFLPKQEECELSA